MNDRMSDMDGLVEVAAEAMYVGGEVDDPAFQWSALHATAKHRYRLRARAALLAVGLPALLERVEAAEALLDRNGARYCLCSRADRARGAARSVCPLHGEPLNRQRDALAAKVADQQAELSTLRVLAHIGIELDNHHNAAMCPYCTPNPEQRERVHRAARDASETP